MCIVSINLKGAIHMGSRTLKIGLVQTAVATDVEANFERTEARIEEAATRGAQVVCLQELFALPYIAQKEEASKRILAEPIPGKASKFLTAAAREYHVVVVGGSLYEQGKDGNLYNTTLVFDEAGARLAKYRKVHIPHDPYYWEQYYFTPGDLGYVSATVTPAKVKIAPLICYDQWFPEPARALALSGVEVIFYPTAIGWYDEFRKAEPFSAQRWEDAMRAHASMNGVFVAAANRVGTEDNLEFWGGSFIADPFGQVVAKASSTEEQVLVAEIDLDLVFKSQDGWGFLRNRRPGSYKELVK